MAEVETTFENEVKPQSKAEKYKAAVKEWGRKQIVGLKRRPQRIVMFFLLAATIYYLFILFVLSQGCFATANNSNTFATGICMFISTLLSILVLVSFLNAFPKRRGASIPFIILVFAMIAGIVATDLVYYIQMNNFIVSAIDTNSEMFRQAQKGQPYIIGHLVLLGISVVAFILLPVYRRLINKIDTSIHIESATENMHGRLDIEEE